MCEKKVEGKTAFGFSVSLSSHSRWRQGFCKGERSVPAFPPLTEQGCPILGRTAYPFCMPLTIPPYPGLLSCDPHEVPHPHQCPLLQSLCQGHSAVWRSSLIISSPLHYWELLNFPHEATWAYFLMAPIRQPSPEIISCY